MKVRFIYTKIIRLDKRKTKPNNVLNTQETSRAKRLMLYGKTRHIRQIVTKRNLKSKY